MERTADRGAQRRAAPPLLQNAFRPFFLAGAFWAAALVPMWVWEFAGGGSGPFASLGLTGHAHEMLYGYLAAIICGFSLTAIPNWTGRAPVAGNGLAALFGLWVAGRIAVLAFDGMIAALVDIAFLFVLAAVAFREVMAGKNWRNLPVVALLTLFALSHLLFHAPEYYLAAIRGTFAVAALLIALIGGRIVPSFTRNWLASVTSPHTATMPGPMKAYDKASIGVLALALLGWVIAPAHLLTGGLLVFAGLTQLVRLARWKGQATLAEPLVWSLHAGYAWLGISVVLIGAAIAWPAAITASAGLHAMAAGLIGTMTLAVMTRASLGHTGRARKADTVTTLIYILAHLGAIIRVCAALHANDTLLLAAGATLWSGAFLLFCIGYAPMLFGSKPTSPVSG
ncbi:NnrS family protein [Maricaulis salignorans]|uniref:NnrS family protein n=1 Tax=Maricaulis salignorans TaxID=144026 RepID=UPI003A935261